MGWVATFVQLSLERVDPVNLEFQIPKKSGPTPDFSFGWSAQLQAGFMSGLQTAAKAVP